MWSSLLDFLDHIIISSSKCPSSQFTFAIQEYPNPHSKEDMLRFIRLIYFFRCFLPSSRQDSSATDRLDEKKSTVFWRGESQGKTFSSTKAALLKAFKGLQRFI